MYIHLTAAKIYKYSNWPVAVGGERPEFKFYAL